MSIYIPELYNQLPYDVCHHIMKFVGEPPTAKLLKNKCNNYKHYQYRYGKYLQDVICKKGFYSYMNFKKNKRLTRKMHFDLIFANWLYENPCEKSDKFVKYYHEESILAIVAAENAGVGDAMADFIDGDTHKFIICFLFCAYIDKFIKKSGAIFHFKIIDLMRMYEDEPWFVEEQFEFFRNCKFKKICKNAFIDYAEDFFEDGDFEDGDFENEDDENEGVEGVEGEDDEGDGV